MNKVHCKIAFCVMVSAMHRCQPCSLCFRRQLHIGRISVSNMILTGGNKLYRFINYINRIEYACLFTIGTSANKLF